MTTTSASPYTYSVTLHAFHGSSLIYEGRSLNQAIRAARKHDCTRGGDCVAGPTLSRTDGDREWTAYDWQAAAPFTVARELEWVEAPR